MVVHRAMLKRIYDWCIDAAHKPYALWILGAVAFAESSFFPAPPVRNQPSTKEVALAVGLSS
jgi:hypothetical protein